MIKRKLLNFDIIKSQKKFTIIKIFFYELPIELVKTVIRLFKIKIYGDLIIQRYDISKIKERSTSKEKLYFDVLDFIGMSMQIENILMLHDDNLSRAYINIFVKDSRFFQYLRWIKCTDFLSSFDDNSLSQYYSNSKSKYYCGYLRLIDESWVKHRFEQFTLINSIFDDKKSLSYLEVGGATGLLPLAAKLEGIGDVYLYEINASDIDFAHKIYSCSSLTENIKLCDLIPMASFDIISCHQVIEHVYEPKVLLSEIYSMLSKGGMLIISTGYHVYPHPGHFYLEEEDFEMLMEQIGFVKHKFISNYKHTHIYTKL